MVMESLLVIVISQHCQCSMVCGMLNIRTFYPSQKILVSNISILKLIPTIWQLTHYLKEFLNDYGGLSVIHLCRRCTMLIQSLPKRQILKTMIFRAFHQFVLFETRWFLSNIRNEKIIYLARPFTMRELLIVCHLWLLEIILFSVSWQALHWLLGWVPPLVG